MHAEAQRLAAVVGRLGPCRPSEDLQGPRGLLPYTVDEFRVWRPVHSGELQAHTDTFCEVATGKYRRDQEKSDSRIIRE